MSIRNPVCLLVLLVAVALGQPATYPECIAANRTLRNHLQGHSIEIVGAGFTRSIDERLLPHWMGTRWDYNGISQVPKQGAIACGYLVTTVLEDAGVKLDRVKLARAASETMIRALVPEEHIRRFRSVPVERVAADLQTWGPGLYLVGLDAHTGFVRVKKGAIEFIHSSGRYRKVLREPFEKSLDIRQSRYRVFGKLSADPKLLAAWVAKK